MKEDLESPHLLPSEVHQLMRETLGNWDPGEAPRSDASACVNNQHCMFFSVNALRNLGRSNHQDGSRGPPAGSASGHCGHF